MIPQCLTEYPDRETKFPFSVKLKYQDIVPAHRHDFLELSLVVEGSGMQMINGREHAMQPGTLIFLLPYQYHEIRSVPGHTLLMYICNFDLELIHNQLEAYPETRSLLYPAVEESLPYLYLHTKQQSLIEHNFREMMGEYREELPWGQVLIKSKLFEILAFFDRWRNEQYRQQHNKAGSRPAIWQIIHYVYQHYYEPLTLAGLAQKFYFNESHLSESFKKYSGKNFVHFLHEIRTRQACSLLLSADMSVSDVALEVGFGSFSSFSRIFKRLKGITPQEFRKLHTEM